MITPGAGVDHADREPPVLERPDMFDVDEIAAGARRWIREIIDVPLGHDLEIIDGDDPRRAKACSIARMKVRHGAGYHRVRPRSKPDRAAMEEPREFSGPACNA